MNLNRRGGRVKMKRTIKKITASLLALLMMIQLVPAFAATYSSGVIAGSMVGYKELMEIVASRGTYVLLGQTLTLDVNEDYLPFWSSSDEVIATIDGWGEVTAVSAGTVTITATVMDPQAQTASIEITVIDPEPILAGTTEEGTPEEGTPEEGQEPEDGIPDEPEKKPLVVVINGENELLTYDGEEHLLDRFVATGNEDFFDETKVRAEGSLGVAGTDCGFYELDLSGVTFSYDDPEVAAHFVVNNSFLKILPATVTVTANAASKEEGTGDPELTATVVGLFGEDTVEYTLEKTPGEAVGEYVINVYGEEQQGNYRVNYVAGIFTIEGEPTVAIESNIPAGQQVYAGTEIQLKAIPAGFGGAELTYQWQYSTDGTNWTDIEGANAQVYTYIIMPENAMYRYRVSVNAAD